MMLFGDAKPESILNLTVQEELPLGEIDYNRLPEWSIVNVYHVPMWVKSALIIKIPRIVIQHELSHVFRQLNTGSTIPLRSIVVLHEQHFCAVIRKDGAIAHASYQSYETPEDVLYHLLYAYRQLQIDKKGELFLHAGTEDLQSTAEKIRSLAAGVQQFSDQKITVHLFEHQQFQTLCV